MQSRRKFLSGTATAAVASLAGCSGSGSSTEEFPTEYSSWIAGSMVTDGPLGIISGDPSQMAEIDALTVPEAEFDQLGATAVTTQIKLVGGGDPAADGPDCTINLGDFDRETARREFGDGDSESDGEYGGLDRYTADGQFTVVGVGDGVVVAARSQAWFESAVDAARGETDRLVEQSEEFDLAVDALDRLDYVTVGAETPELEAAVAGLGYDFAAEESEVVAEYVYESDQAATEHQGEATTGPAFRRAQNPDVEVDGRQVTATATVPTDAIFSEPTQQAPETRFLYDYTTTDAGSQVEITHAGGDDLDPDSIYIRGSAVDGELQWSERADEFTAGVSLTLTEGDALVSEPAGERIEIQFDTGDRTVTIASWEVPE